MGLRRFPSQYPGDIPIRRLSACFAAALTLTGCRDQKAELFVRYQPAFDSLGRELRELAPLADSSTPQHPAAPLQPAPEFAGWGTGNGVALMTGPSDGPQLSLSYPGLGEVMEWVAQPGNFSASWQQLPRQELERQLDAALRWRYLLTVRVLSWVEPAVTESTFAGGQLAVRGALLDRADRRVLCVVDAAVEPPKSIAYSYHLGFAEERSKAAMAVRGAVFDSARASLGRALTVCGGRYALDSP